MRKKALAKALRNPTNGVGVLGAWRLACCCFAPRPGRLAWLGLACSTDRVRGGGGSRARPFPNWNGCFHLLLLSLSLDRVHRARALLVACWVGPTCQHALSASHARYY